MRILAMAMIVVGLCGLPALGATRKLKETQAPAKKPSGKAAAARLRAEWDMGELSMMKLVVEDAQIDPQLKASLGDTVTRFTQQQEDLLAQVEADPSTEAAVQKKRAKLYAAYMDKMQAAYKDPAIKQDIARRMKALDKEIDSIYASAETLMSKLDAIGVTPEQKAKIAPVAKEANKKVKAEVDKSETRSTKDKKNKDKVVASYKEIRKKLRQELTPEQREKLTKKLAEEA